MKGITDERMAADGHGSFVITSGYYWDRVFKKQSEANFVKEDCG